MANQDDELNLPDLSEQAEVKANVEPNVEAEAGAETSPHQADDMEIKEDEEDEDQIRSAVDLEAVFDVPVNVSAVLGKTYIEVSDLLKLGSGSIIELDRKVGEAIDIYVNDRLVARGEVIIVENRLGITMTEIIKSGIS